ncbi:MAG: hypothetical protein GF417_00760 [Candidatus Latescibacteria bacterium]|nr:hypothetical protein [bacterium]MBD3422957.1 hypothetical protein [Candidatus Latescibacterota bacterium]
MYKDIDIWLPAWIRQQFRKRRGEHPLTILFAMADHFEPMQKPSDPPELQLDRVSDWIEQFEERFGSHRDSKGRPPLHTYFYPQEQYREDLLEMLAGHCRRGFGEVEIHIHHDRDTEEDFLEKIGRFKEQLASHQLLCEESGELKYGFVHGNWALDNSRRDGRWCGLNNEITLLKQTGCYADFTLPCAPADGQTRKINSIYYANDDPEKPKSHDRGRDLSLGGRDDGDLLMIQGPLALSWAGGGLIPGIDNGDVSSGNPMTGPRIALWVNQGISVRGREDVIFVKVHCHGMKPRNMEYILSEQMERGLDILENDFNDGKNYILNYVTAREMANVAIAYNEGENGPISELRDYRLKWPR